MSGTVTATFSPPSGNFWTVNDIQVSAPVVTETDTGAVESFIGGTSPFTFSTSYTGFLHRSTLSWGAGHAGVSTAGSGFTLNFNYNLTVTGANTITSLSQVVFTDITLGSFNLSATETVTDPTGHVVATDVWNPTSGSPQISLGSGYTNLSVSITVQASIGIGQSGTVEFSSLSQSYFETPVTQTPAITVDKQISIDGVHWFEAGQNNLAGPTVLAGDKVYERAIVTDSGNTALSGVNVADLNGLPGGFTFSGASSISMTAGQTITSDIGTVIAGAGTNYDTATATGTVSTGGAVSSTDKADYTGVSPAVTLDKQISINGTTWQDVGNGNIAQDPAVLAGATVYERVIVANTGSIALNNATVGDISNTGGAFPPDFTFGGNASVATLAVGGAITSDVATFTASAGYQLDTATVTATATDTVNTATVTASDKANYTGVPYSGGSTPVTIDKQVSANGSTWLDVGNGVLNGPTVLTGSTVYERVIVVDTGTLAINGATVTDVSTSGGTFPADFTFGGAGTVTIGSGQTLVSDIATLTAAAFAQLDTATVSGTVTDTVNTATVAASDVANYVGVTPSIGIDKQVSVNGGATWQDVGSLLNDPTVLAGAAVEERVIVTDTGSIGLTGLSVADIATLGTALPAGFTFGGAATLATLAAGASITSDIATLTAVSGHQIDQATVTGTATDSAGNTATVKASDQADYTGVTPAIAVDKQISVNGGATWVDVGNGNLAQDPTVLTGSTVLERVIVSDTGATALSGVAVSDVIGSTAAGGFTFGGAGSTTLSAGGAITSDVTTLTAASGYQLDTATASGTATDTSGNTKSVTASDQANYTGVTPSISIDKQISVNGGATWVDVGNGNLAQDPTVLTGATVEERVIVSDTGATALSGVAVSDVIGSTAAAGFTFGCAGTTTLSAGGAITSDVTTLTAASGYQLDTATATGTATDSAGNTKSVTASDQANYTGVTPAIAVDKQISVNGGATWVDVGKALNDPTVLTGTSVEERVIVTNTGSIGLGNLAVTDAITAGSGAAQTFTLANSTLAAGASEVSNVVTFAALTGYQQDQAGVTGTATDSVGNTQTVTASDKADYTGTIVSTGTPGISIIKLPQTVAICAGSSETYTFDVTNTGSVALTNVQLSDNIGTASNPIDVTPTQVLVNGYNVGDTNHDGILSVGETWQYTVTLNPAGTGSGDGGSDKNGSGGKDDNGQGNDKGSGGSGSGDKSGSGNDNSGSNCATGSSHDNSGHDNSGSGSSGSSHDNSGHDKSGSGSSGSSHDKSGHDNSGSGSSGSSHDKSGHDNSGSGSFGSGDKSGSRNDKSGSGSSGSSHDKSGASSNCSIGTSSSDNTSPDNSSSQLTPLSSSEMQALTTGGTYGPPAPATFPDGPYTVASGATSELTTGPAASNADSVLLVVSATASQVAALGSQTVTLDYGGETVTFSASDFATSAADGFPSKIGGIANGQVNGISFPTAEHAAVDIVYNKSLSSLFGPTGSNIAPVTIDSPINLRVDVFGDNNGKIVGNAANSGAEGVTGGTGGGGGGGGGSGGSSAPIYTGVADTVTVTATTASGATVTASDTKEVLLLGSANSGSQDGSGNGNSGTGCSTGSSGDNAGSSDNSGSGSSGSGGNDQSGSGSGCNTGSSGSGDKSGSGSNDNSGGGSYGSGGNDQSGTGSNCNTGSSGSGDKSGSGSNDNSGSGSYGSSGNDQSGSGSGCTTGAGSSGDKSGSGGDSNGSGCTTGSGSDTSGSGACGSGISLNGTQPTGNLPTLYGTAQTLEFTYAPGDTVSLASGSTALASVTGSTPSSMAFMEMSNNANPFASGGQIYFQGAVQSGENIFADATINPLTNTANPSGANQFSTASGAELFGFVFSSQAAFLAGNAPTETMTLATSSGHGMTLGDTIGSLKLTGYVGTTGGHLIA